MKSNDWNIIPHINKRYEEITEELRGVSSLDDFIKEKAIRKAAIFDLLQIGELLNHVSKELQESIGDRRRPT